MSRLPQPGKDNGQWGDILNDFLSQAHEANGSIKSGVVTTQSLADASITASKLAPGTISATGISGSYVDLTNKPTIPTTPTQVGAEPAGLSVATQAVLDSTYATFGPVRDSVYGPRWVFDGDSITIGGITSLGGSGQDRNNSWAQELTGRSMGAINFVFNAAVAGQRLDQALGRFDLFVAPYTPSVVFLTIGTNDIGQGRTLDAYLSDLSAYLAKARGIRARLIIGAIWPSDATDIVGRSATGRLWNDAIYSWAATNGVDVMPWDQLANPATGGWPAGWSSDGIHPGLIDSHSQIGLFAYNTLSAKLGLPNAVRRATSQVEGLLTNGFLLDTVSTYTAPTISTAVAATDSGTIPAGTYSYKATSRSYYGETLPGVERSVTLSATGKVALTISAPTGNRARRLYRKGPTDTDWLLVAVLTSTGTNYTDDGSIAPGSPVPSVDSSYIPTGLSVGSSTLHKMDGTPLLRTVTGIKGNVLHMTPYETGTGDSVDFFSVSGINPGDVFEVSMLLRSSGPLGAAKPIVRFRSAVPANTGGTIISGANASNGWRLVRVIATAPVNTVSLRVSIEFTYLLDWLEVAELRAVKIS